MEREHSTQDGTPKDQYNKMNQCLYQLESLLRNMGVSSFSVGENGRQVIWDNETNDQSDPAKIGTFCNEIEHLYTDLLTKKEPDGQ